MDDKLWIGAEQPRICEGAFSPSSWELSALAKLLYAKDFSTLSSLKLLLEVGEAKFGEKEGDW